MSKEDSKSIASEVSLSHPEGSCQMPDAENIQVCVNQSSPTKAIRNVGKRPIHGRRGIGRKRSYSHSEGTLPNKRFKRAAKMNSAVGKKFLLGGNIHDPLNLMALNNKETDLKKTEIILQPKKFEGRPALQTVTVKRWKRHNSTSFEKKKFLLGGNCRDPLNLNSFSDEKVAQLANAVTPESSPMPTPQHRKAEYRVEVLIPPNISDPLNLMNCNDDEDQSSRFSGFSFPEPVSRLRRYQPGSSIPKFDSESSLMSKKPRQRKRAKSLIFGNLSVPDQADVENTEKGPESDKQDDVDQSPSTNEDHSTETCQKSTTELAVEKSTETEQQKEKKVSVETKLSMESKQTRPKRSGKSQIFEYGNYNRYYGYRNPTAGILPESVEDVRLYHFKPEWFFGKDVLDIGCNVGALTLEIGRRFAPKSLLGIDIDPNLISVAKKFADNLKKYRVPVSAKATPIPTMSACTTPSRTAEACVASTDFHSMSSKQTNCESLFPISFPLIYGPLFPGGPSLGCGGQSDRSTSATATPHPYLTPRATSQTGFPSLSCRKVRFMCENYVLESNDLLELVQPEFDTIVCLSTTKWIHLNFGDDGIKRAFKRMYAQLRPGGVLILEAQGFESYEKKRKLTSRILDNFQSLTLLPNQFSDYLLQEVGFSSAQIVGVPRHQSKGFQRPIQVFSKMPLLSTRSLGETSSTQHTPNYSFSNEHTPHSNQTTPNPNSCPGSSQATPHYFHHYTNPLGESDATN